MAGFVAIVAIAVASAWSALVVDTIVESTEAGGGSIVALRTTLLVPGVRVGVSILCGLAASAGLAVAAAAAHARGRRLERRMTAELDARYQEVTARAAGDVARAELLSWRVAELRTSMKDLIGQRDQLLAEMELARRRTAELRALAEDYKRSLTELQNRLIVLPEVEDELARRRAQRKADDPTG
jgi:tRNA A37 threonylcarbamoyladenosine modification protein TsaB